MKTVFINKFAAVPHAFLFALVQLADTLVRLLSLGILNTSWPAMYAQRHGRKAIEKHLKQKAAKKEL